MPDIDPSDVLPQNNLPSPSAQWGRALEKRLLNVEKRVLIDKQDIDGQNRTTAAQMSSLSEQLTAISDAQATLADQQATLVDQQATLVDQQARMAETQVVATADFNVSSDSYDQTQITTVTPPEWARYAHVSASYLAKTSSPYSKWVISGVSVMVEDDGSYQSRQEIMFGSFINEGVHWMPGVPPSPSVVDLEATLRQVNITDHVHVEESGTGSIDITSFYFITFIQ